MYFIDLENVLFWEQLSWIFCQEHSYFLTIMFKSCGKKGSNNFFGSWEFCGSWHSKVYCNQYVYQIGKISFGCLASRICTTCKQFLCQRFFCCKMCPTLHTILKQESAMLTIKDRELFGLTRRRPRFPN